MRVIKYHIKERSWMARLAARRLGGGQVAMVIGRTIHLHGVSREQFLSDKRWLRHEQEHLRQFADYGTLRFLVKYLMETARRGYYHNKYEAEARMAESDYYSA